MPVTEQLHAWFMPEKARYVGQPGQFARLRGVNGFAGSGFLFDFREAGADSIDLSAKQSAAEKGQGPKRVRTFKK